MRASVRGRDIDRTELRSHTPKPRIIRLTAMTAMTAVASPSGYCVMTRILLIDDDTELVSLLSEYLIQDGFSVTSTSDGEVGAAEALAGRHAIAVLDVMMPRLNGLDVLRHIRRESTLPVLMLTARGDDADRITGLELGADDYVTKPCTPRELVARLRAILRRTTPGTA